MLVRYQLKHSFPVERRASSVGGLDRLPFGVVEVRRAGLG